MSNREFMKTVILAGGRGRRLLPYSTNFPKPLMPVGERPILEILLCRLRDQGLTEILVATGHLEELIRAYFGDGGKWGIRISYSREQKPMGTAGPLDLVRDQLSDTFLLINGDTLTDINFRDLITFHREMRAAATVAVYPRNVSIDFGVVEIDAGDLVTGWREKPNLEYSVSTGIYAIERASLSALPRDTMVNLPDFLTTLRVQGQRVAAYAHRGYWLDIGRPEDYERACRDVSTLT